MHIPPAHVNPVEHAEPAQQSCMSPPQATHLPWLPQRLPAAHVEPEQQSWPGPPQVPQVPALEQVSPVAVQRWPAQQS